MCLLVCFPTKFLFTTIRVAVSKDFSSRLRDFSSIGLTLQG